MDALPRGGPRLSLGAGLVSTLALVIAVSMGGAYAADKVGSGGIKKNAVKTRHIAAAGRRPARTYATTPSTPSTSATVK